MVSGELSAKVCIYRVSHLCSHVQLRLEHSLGQTTVGQLALHQIHHGLVAVGEALKISGCDRLGVAKGQQVSPGRLLVSIEAVKGEAQ